ncbi:MAG: class I SAM-dependent methyltransferase [Verrucomicrobia bacterium]|nr:class I SAM-dependent methyltransferase [Verrucomicrobiota bacterium]
MNMYDELVPIDILFTYPSRLQDSHRSCGDSGPVTAFPVPIVVSTAMEAVDSIVKGQEDIASYHQDCVASGMCQPDISKADFLRNLRRRIRALRWNPFSRRPIISDIQNDCLIVQDGIELCCLTKELDKSWIKVSMPEDVHAKWLTRSTEDLDKVVVRTSRKEFYNPIDHPAYRKAKIARRNSIRLDRIRQLLGPIGPGICGLDIGCNMGYTSHHLQRQGFNMTGIDYDDYHLDIAKALTTTYGLDVRLQNCYFRQFQTDHPFDIVVALTVLYHMFYNQEEQDIPECSRMDKTAVMEKIDTLTRHALIWESGADPPREIDFIRSNSGLSEYYFLGPTQGTGKKRNLGVFLRPGTAFTDYLRNRYTAKFAGRWDYKG